MQPDAHPYQTYNYSDIFSEYFFHGETGSTYSCPEHALIFIFSGKLIICSGDYEKIISKGGYIFLSKDENTILIRKSCNGEPFSSVFMGFNYNFLSDFHQNMKKKDIPEKTEHFLGNIIELPCTPQMESMYVSLQPYLQWNIRPVNQIVEIKLIEAILSLLLTSNSFYTCLFEFPASFEAGNIIINDNCVPDTVCEEFFATPIACAFSKKLETAYIRLQQENNAANIYMEAYYKNIIRIFHSSGRPYNFTTYN